VESVDPVKYTAKRWEKCEEFRMSTVITPPLEVRDQRVVLNHVSWETYERLLADHVDAKSPRFTYDQGVLEIITLSSRHEGFTEVMAAIVELVAEERGVEFVNLGSTTFRRQDLKRGLEPDKCFYLRNVARIRG
jgi:Uma2 family endonuclease